MAILILNFAVGLPGRKCLLETNWPSWVPNYAAKQNLVASFLRPFQVCAYIPSKPALAVDGRLKLLGFYFDHIVSMLAVHEECSSEPRAALAQHQKWRSFFGLPPGAFGSSRVVNSISALIWKPSNNDARRPSVPYIGCGTLEEDNDSWTLRRYRHGRSNPPEARRFSSPSGLA